jgi:CRP/FNR family transcriptional regulator, cyclic AMP receptor protein
MFSVQEKISYLQKVSALKSLTPEQFETLAEKCEVQSFPVGKKIFSQGDTGGGVYVVVAGRVSIDRELSDKTDTISMRMVKEGACFGEISLFYDATRTATAMTVTDTIVILLKHEDFYLFSRNNPDVLIELNHVICQRLVEAYDKISEIKTDRKPVELQQLYDKLDF